MKKIQTLIAFYGGCLILLLTGCQVIFPESNEAHQKFHLKGAVKQIEGTTENIDQEYFIDKDKIVDPSRDEFDNDSYRYHFDKLGHRVEANFDKQGHKETKVYNGELLVSQVDTYQIGLAQGGYQMDTSFSEFRTYDKNDRLIKWKVRQNTEYGTEYITATIDYIQVSDSLLSFIYKAKIQIKDGEQYSKPQKGICFGTVFYDSLGRIERYQVINAYRSHVDYTDGIERDEFLTNWYPADSTESIIWFQYDHNGFLQLKGYSYRNERTQTTYVPYIIGYMRDGTGRLRESYTWGGYEDESDGWADAGMRPFGKEKPKWSDFAPRDTIVYRQYNAHNDVEDKNIIRNFNSADHDWNRISVDAKISYQYEYDQQGNWVCRAKYVNDRLYSINKRHIKYYGGEMSKPTQEFIDDILAQNEKQKRLAEERPLQFLEITQHRFEPLTFQLLGSTYKSVGYHLKGEMVNVSDRTFVVLHLRDHEIDWWYDARRSPHIEVLMNDTMRISCVQFDHRFDNWHKMDNVQIPQISFSSPWKPGEIKEIDLYFQPNVSGGYYIGDDSWGSLLQPIHFNYEPASCALHIPVYVEDPQGYKQQFYLSFDILDDYKSANLN